MLTRSFVLYVLLHGIIFVSSNPVKVVVTGASSSVGFHVFQKLLHKKNVYPIGLVRDMKGYKNLITIGAAPEQIRIGDITKKETIRGAFDGATKCVLCTSARPRKRLPFTLKSAFKSVFGKAVKPLPSDLYYPNNASPYHVDYLGQKNVIDEMIRVGAEHIIMLGNMGGYRGSKLNDIGRKSDEKDPKVGNLLKWKRASERYLMKRCFFTIIHAASLIDNRKGNPHDVIWDVDDALLRTPYRTISKEEVADVLVSALVYQEAIGRSIDVASKPSFDEKTNRNWLRFWSMSGNCCYPVDFDQIDS